MHYHKKNYFQGGGKWKSQNTDPDNRLIRKVEFDRLKWNRLRQLKVGNIR